MGKRTNLILGAQLDNRFAKIQFRVDVAHCGEALALTGRNNELPLRNGMSSAGGSNRFSDPTSCDKTLNHSPRLSQSVFKLEFYLRT